MYIKFMFQLNIMDKMIYFLHIMDHKYLNQVQNLMNLLILNLMVYNLFF